MPLVERLKAFLMSLAIALPFQERTLVCLIYKLLSRCYNHLRMKVWDSGLKLNSAK